MDQFSLNEIQISHLLEYGEVEHEGKKISMHDYLADNPINKQILEVANKVIGNLSTQLSEVQELLSKERRQASYGQGDKDLQYRDSLIKRIQKFEAAFNVINQKVHPEKDFGFKTFLGRVHLTKDSEEIVEYRKIKKALSTTKKLASIKFSENKTQASEITVVDNQVLDANQRFVVRGNTYGATVSGTTWGNTTMENVHSIRPTLNLDASSYLKTDDGGGIIVSADGYGRGNDEQGPLDKNIAYIAHQACNYLSKVLTDTADADDIVKKADQFVNDTDAYLKECNKTERGQMSGGVNIVGIRVFANNDRSQVRVVGVSVGNQVVMVTDFKTGKTTQINPPIPSESSYKCFLGGDDKQGKSFAASDVNIIDYSETIPAEDALVWVATCGTWQNLDREDESSNRVNTSKLSEQLGANKSPIDLVADLSAQTQERSKSVREKIPKLFRKLNTLDAQHRTETDENKKLEIKLEAERTQKEIKHLHQALDDASITVFRPF